MVVVVVRGGGGEKQEKEDVRHIDLHINMGFIRRLSLIQLSNNFMFCSVVFFQPPSTKHSMTSFRSGSIKS